MPKSYKHSSSKRAHIPSKKEAGYEFVKCSIRESEVTFYLITP